jgi:CheY-like chemotaxis protein
MASRLHPAAIVLDVKMPGMSGWEVLSTLKLSAATTRIPVIMLTVMQQQEIGQALGAIDYLIKPVEPERLCATLRRHVPEVSARVLLVEDDEPTRELIRRTLEGAGYEVTEAENGQVALDRLPSANPDIIVLDLMMPVMDGFSFLHHLRTSEEHNEVPVIVATARELDESERHELTSMAQRVFQKQAFSREELLEMIAGQIHEMVEQAGKAGA